MSLYSIGHGNVAVNVFTGLLQRHEIELLVDTRSQPYSRFNPQFNRETLRRSITAVGLNYTDLGATIGGRPKSEQFYFPHGKADYERLEQAEFYQAGIAQLLAFAAVSRVAFMCSEMNYLHCHRYHLITRTLVQRGVAVAHILPAGELVISGAAEFAAAQLSLF